MCLASDEKLRAYVASVDSDSISIEIFDDTIKSMMEERGYCHVEKSTWRKYLDEKEQLEEMTYLRDIGIPFSEGQGWPPADVFEYLVEQGQLSWPYKCIAWSAPGKYTIVEHYRDRTIPPWKKP